MPSTIESRLNKIEGMIRVLLTKVGAGGGGGTTDHAALSNLDYASADHTGFSPDTHNHTGVYEPAGVAVSDITDFSAAHASLTTGVHGVGAGTIAKTADITATKLDDFAATDDNTDLNVSTSAHGLCPKLDNTVTNFLNGQGGWTAPGGSGGALVLIDEQTVSGSAVQSLTFSSLDLDTDGFWILIGYWKNARADWSEVYMQANSDTTWTHYYNQNFEVNAGSLTGGRANNARILYTGTSGQNSFVAFIHKISGCMPRAEVYQNWNPASSVEIFVNNWIWNDTTNITQLVLYDSRGSDINVGSKFALFKLVMT